MITVKYGNCEAVNCKVRRVQGLVKGLEKLKVKSATQDTKRKSYGLITDSEQAKALREEGVEWIGDLSEVWKWQ